MFDTPGDAPGAPIAPEWHSAFIAPDGTFHYVPTHSHYLVAPILHRTMPDTGHDASICAYADDCQDSLLARGYIRLSEGTLQAFRPATYQQRDTLYEVGAFIASHDDTGHTLRAFRATFDRATGEEFYFDA